MRRLIVCLVVPLFLCGCTYRYGAAYQPDCAITKSQARAIAADIFRGLGLTPKLTEDYQGRLAIQITVPYENKPGETVNPGIGIAETDQGLAIGFEDNGKGDNPLSKKMSDVVEQALLHNGCSSWKRNEEAHSFSFK